MAVTDIESFVRDLLPRLPGTGGLESANARVVIFHPI